MGSFGSPRGKGRQGGILVSPLAVFRYFSPLLYQVGATGDMFAWLRVEVRDAGRCEVLAGGDSDGGKFPLLWGDVDVVLCWFSMRAAPGDEHHRCHRKHPETLGPKTEECQP